MRRCAPYLFICCLSVSLFAQTSSDSAHVNKLTIKGYVKQMQQALFTKQISQMQTGSFIHNRIQLQYNINNHLYVRSDLRNRIFYGELTRINPNDAAMLENPNDYIDLTKVWYDQEALLLHTVIDRAYIQYSKNKVELSAGRQRINWGINTVWTPNDIFNTYNFFDFDYEERPGSDGIRLAYSPNGFTTVEVAYKAGRNKYEHIGAGIYRFNKWNYDIQLLTGLLNTDWVLGGGWAGNLGDAGFKGETSLLLPVIEREQQKWGLLSTLSIDYAFDNNWYGNASFLYNQSGVNTLNSIEGFYTTRLTLRNLMPFQYSWCMLVNKAITPIFGVNMASIYSPASQALIAVPSISYSLADNWDLLFTGQLFFAEQNNRYTTLGNAFFMRIKWSY
jgi:hypothetical protein